jgi:uncharacterized cupin superfamily protein
LSTASREVIDQLDGVELDHAHGGPLLRARPHARGRPAPERQIDRAVRDSVELRLLEEHAATIMPRMEHGVSFASLDPDGEDRFQRMRQELGVSTFGMNLIRLRPGQRGRIHRHERQEEVYVVIAGTLTLIVEDESYELPRGDVARVGPEVRRQLVNRHPELLLVLAAGGATEHAGRDGRAWASWDEEGEGRPPQEVELPSDVEVG